MLPIHQHIDFQVKDYFGSWIDFTAGYSIAVEENLGVIVPNMVRQHFLFYTLMDVLCFCHFHPYLLKNRGSNIFTAIGFRPCQTYILHLKERFPNARFVAVFDDNLLGRVLDCIVLLAYIGKECSFKILNGEVLFNYKDQDFVVTESVFSLHRFRLLTGIRSNFRTIKPKGAVSFIQLLMQQIRS